MNMWPGALPTVNPTADKSLSRDTVPQAAPAASPVSEVNAGGVQDHDPGLPLYWQ